MIKKRPKSTSDMNRTERPRPQLSRRPPSTEKPSGKVFHGVRAAHKDLACAIKKECGSCKYVNEPYQISLQQKVNASLHHLQERGLLEGLQLQPAVPSPHQLHYRTHAKLAVRKGNGDKRFAIGLFKPQSHDVINLDHCPLHVDPINRLLSDLRELLEASTIEPFDEQSGFGHLKYLAIRWAHMTRSLSLTFVVQAPIDELLKPLCTQLEEKGHRLGSVHVNINQTLDNVIFGTVTRRIAGQSKIKNTLCGLNFELSPTAFFQVNPWQAENIYRRIEGMLAPGYGVAWDLYSGSGQIAMIMARAGYQVTSIEESEEGHLDAIANSKRNQLSDRMRFEQGLVEDVIYKLLAKGEKPRMVIANPSRRGIAESARNMLSHLFTKLPDCQFIYMSCEMSTMARDIEEITKNSPLKLRQLEPFDMFPQTEKVEWLAVLTR